MMLTKPIKYQPTISPKNHLDIVPDSATEELHPYFPQIVQK